MAEPFKNFFNRALVDKMVAGIQRSFPDFDNVSFVKDVFNDQWEEKELKYRMYHISEMLGKFLPDDYPKSVKILKEASPELSGLGHMCFPDYVERFGLEDFETSVEALEYLTQFSSSEFAVRPFIIKYGSKMMDVMMEWSKSENEHVRRLASEGCRSRLPWAIALPDFKKNPDPILPILEQLKDDESEYVRRSVANNLNDISKDNPQILLQITEKWIGKTTNTDKLLKHACRTMLKKGDPQFLTLFGYGDVNHISLESFSIEPFVKMGEYITFQFVLASSEESLGKLRLEYAVDYLKKNGTHSRKVFKIGESFYKEARREVVRKHSFKPITTRVYYPGEHFVTLIINGIELVKESFVLLSDKET